MPVLDTIVGDLPLPIGGGVVVGVPPSDVDVLINRIPFWLAITKDTPYQRETAQFTRDQVDQQPEAGEQSLAGWWTRSQMSFHGGAGLDYLDTNARPDELDRVRFKDSYNVDCWTPGVLRALNGTTLAKATLPGERLWLEPVDGDGVVLASPSKIQVFTGTAWVEVNYGSPFPVRAFCTDGVAWYAATIDGVYSGPLATPTTVGTKLYNLPSTDVPMCLGFVKQRLMLGHGRAVYALDSPGPALPTAKLTHPTAGWGWTAFTDGPGGILACGYAGLSSAVYVFELTTVADAPVLAQGKALISLPAGERVLSATLYLQSLLILGTNRGLRVCPFDTYYGSVSLGPLTFEGRAVSAVAGYDRFVFAGTVDTLLRVDLAQPLDQGGHYAWAPDLPVAGGTVTGIAFRTDGRKWLGLAGVGAFTEDDAPNPALTSWLQTARIRMGTVEDKHWPWAAIRGTYSEADQLQVWVESPTAPFTLAHSATLNNARFGLKVGRSEWVALRFAFAGASELNSYQVQALPAGKRQRLISVPVSVADRQITRSQREIGYDGWAMDRLAQLEHLEENGEEVTLSAPALFPEAVRCVIERLSLSQVKDPVDRGGTYGVLQILLRTTS
jgi:hypothetical protein